MSICIDISCQLVWALANMEANLSGDAKIRPIHLYLGILKSSDHNFYHDLKGVEIPTHEGNRLNELAKQIRVYMEMKSEEIKSLRKKIRLKIRKGGGNTEENSKLVMLHRSDESREVFKLATQKAIQSGVHELNVLHLLESIFELNFISSDIETKSHSSVNSSGARWKIENGDSKSIQNNMTSWYGRNLTQLAKDKLLPPFVGRETELKTILRAFSREVKKNVVIIGDSGIGKTALVEGIAINQNEFKGLLINNRSQILELRTGDLFLDSHENIQIEKKLFHILDYISKIPDSILFLDNFYALSENYFSPSIVSLFVDALSSNHFTFICCTLPDHWAAITKKFPQLSRLFHEIKLKQPSNEECKNIAHVWAKYISLTQSVMYESEAINFALEASQKLINNNVMPDKLIDLLENAATFVKVGCLMANKNVDNCKVKIIDIERTLKEHYGIVF